MYYVMCNVLICMLHYYKDAQIAAKSRKYFGWKWPLSERNSYVSINLVNISSI